ncbi:PPC domain-containing protein, partial [Vibrio harveyi]
STNGGVVEPPVTTCDITVLVNGVSSTVDSASTGQWRCFTIDVPTGSTELNVVTSGSDGDADLYVKLGSAPSETDYDCRSYSSNSNESCTLASPSAGTWHIGVYAYATYNNLSVTATYVEDEAPPPPPPETDITTSSTNNGKTWKARISGSGLLGGSWSLGGVCNSDTECALSGIPKKTSSVNFTLSDGRVFTILKP